MLGGAHHRGLGDLRGAGDLRGRVPHRAPRELVASQRETQGKLVALVLGGPQRTSAF